MQRKVTLFVAFAIVSLSIIDAQINPTICPFGEITDTDPLWKPVPSRFELVTELIADNEVAEVSQAFSSYRDAIVFTGRGSPINLYWYFDTNEEFEVVTLMMSGNLVTLCVGQVINGSLETSSIASYTLYLKPSVLLGFDSRNQPNKQWGVRYVGNSNMRGIPTRVFESCFYVADLQATASVTYQVSDSDRFQGYLPNNESTILQMQVKIAKSDNNVVSYIYNVFRYVPNPRHRDLQQALETPMGVFCPGRVNTLAVPTRIPERFGANNEGFSSSFAQSIISANQLFDGFFQFSRAELWMAKKNETHLSHLAQIHDFALGLSYAYDYETHLCQVTKLGNNSGDVTPVDGRPDLVQMSNPLAEFLSPDANYQYVGEKRCRDRVWCHVWIGERSVMNGKFIEHREMYWVFEINDITLPELLPAKVIVTTFDGNRTFLNSYETALFNFRENPTTLLEVDALIADCYRAMGPEENFNLGVISFTIANDREYPVFRNIEALQYTIWEVLTVVLQVRPSRISNIIVNHDGKDLPVALTMLDASPIIGPVEFPPKELSLAQVIERLRAAIDSNSLAFRARYDTKEVMLRARPSSLQVLYTTFDRNAPQCANQTVALRQEAPPSPTVIKAAPQRPAANEVINETKYKSTGSLIAGIWIGFVTLGLIIGVIGGFFISQRFFKR